MQRLEPEKKISRARTQLLLEQPFFGTLALKLKMVPNPFIPTACTDGKEMLYNPDWIDGLDMKQLRGLLAHEVMHCGNGHIWRRGAKDPWKWNQACDLAINPILIEAGFTLPDSNWKTYAAENGINIDSAVERIYNQLPDEQEEDEQEGIPCGEGMGSGENGDVEDENQKQNEENGNVEDEQNNGDSEKDEQEGDGGESEEIDDNEQEGANSSNGSKKQEKNGKTSEERAMCSKDPFGCGGIMDGDADEDEKEMEAEWKAALVQAEAVAGAGNLPAGIRRMIDNMIDPELPYDVLLRDFLEQTANDDYNWSNPSRRFTGSGFILPGLKSEELPDVVFVNDTSGSVGQKECEIFASVLSDLLGHYNTTIHAIDCDADIHKVRELTPEDLPLKMEMYGGGGTDFNPPFEWVEKQGLEPSCMLYLTDLEPWNGFPPEPEYPVVWLSTGPTQEAPYGQVIDLQPLLDK